MKTIFYKTTNDKEKANYWFGNIPTIEWFTLENTLYDLNGEVSKRTIVEQYIRSISTQQVHDTFTDEGIIRRIALRISDS